MTPAPKPVRFYTEAEARRAPCEGCGTTEGIQVVLTGSLGRITPLCSNCKDRLIQTTMAFLSRQNIIPSSTFPGPRVVEAAHWYELEWLLPGKDILLLAGGLLVCYGVYALYAPYTHAGAWIIAGAGLMRLAWLMGKK
jgi:hypothetical protein